MKKNLKEYIIVLMVIVLVGLLLISITNKIVSYVKEFIDMEWNNEPIYEYNKNFGINYSNGKYIYKISCGSYEEYISIKKLVRHKCQSSVDSSCPEQIIDEYEIYLEKDELNVTKELIEKLNSNYGNEYYYGDLYIENNDLDNDSLKIINNLLSHGEIVDYKITYSSSNGSIKERGYKLTRLNNFLLLEVGSGEKPNSCYELELKDIVKSGNDIYMVVDEKELTPDIICMTEISYPNIGIRISDEYDNIIISDMNNKEYNQIEVTE